MRTRHITLVLLGAAAVSGCGRQEQASVDMDCLTRCLERSGFAEESYQLCQQRIERGEICTGNRYAASGSGRSGGSQIDIDLPKSVKRGGFGTLSRVFGGSRS